MTTQPLQVGDILDGFCGGAFGRDYLDKRVEAIGEDWVVARSMFSGCEEELPFFFAGDPQSLVEYRQ